MATQLKHVFDGRFEITVDIPDFVSYLHYDNKLEILNNLKIRSIDSKAHDSIELQIRLVSGTTEFSEVSKIDLPEITPALLDLDVDFKLLSKLFISIESNRTAEFEFELFENGQSIGLKTVSTELYPMNFWKRGEHHFSDILLLAAFSQPNDPAIKTILKKAGEIKGTLKAPDGSNYEPNTRGYQGEPHEVRAELQAIYEALQTFGIRYSNPVANFNGIGQPIRTPSEILESKAATCLDSAMLVASVLEAIRLRPIVLTVPEHAFVGVWLHQGAFTEPIQLFENVTGALKDHIQLIETTTICNSENMWSFEDSCSENLKWLDEGYNQDNPNNVIPRVALDVVKCRTSQVGIHPLPTAISNPDGSVTIVQTELPKVEFNFTGSVDAPRMSLKEDNSPERMKIWKASLLDQTFNNPLLNLNRRSGSTVRLAVPNGKLGNIEDFLQDPKNKFGLTAVNQILRGKYDKLPDEIDAIANEMLVHDKNLGFFVSAGAPYASIRKLANASAASVQETGVNNLYMTFGSLTWDRDPNNPAAGQVTSPLFLLPVRITNLGRDQFILQLDDATDNAAPNETLALALANAKVNVPQLSNPETDDAGFDIPGLIKHVREQVNVVHKKPNWVVNEDSFIGTFDFSSFHMWKDLNDNWEKLAEAPLVKHLIETDGSTGYVDPKANADSITDEALDAEMARLPIESDAAQVKAVLKSLTGESFIIQGPPGTGKSQTITNLLARNLQEGKRVLFMSEKAAALGVVKSRLDEIGLGSYILDLHDKGTKPANIRNQLLAALDASQDVDRTGLETASGEYDTAVRVLSKYPGRLHAVIEKYGESVYSARDRLLEIPGTEILTFDRKFVLETGRKEFEALLIAFRELPDIGENAKTIASNEWSFARIPTEQLTLERKDLIRAWVRNLRDNLQIVSQIAAAKAIVAKATSVADLASFKSLAGVELPSASEMALARTPESALQRRNLRAQLTTLLNASQSNPYFSPKLRMLNLAEMQMRLVEAANGGLFKGGKLKTAAEHLVNFVNGPVTKDNVQQIFESVRPIVEAGLKVDELKATVVGLGSHATADVFVVKNAAALQGRLFELDSFVEATDPSKPNGQLLLDAITSGAGAQLATIGDVATAVDSVFQLVAATDGSVAAWAGSQPMGAKIIETIDKLYESAEMGELRGLTRWADVITIIQPLIKLEQHTAVNELLTGVVDYNDAPRALQRGYFKLLFEKLVDDQEIANFEGRSHDSKISQLGASLKNLRDYNRGQIAADVLATRKFDASSSVGVTGALRAELTKQRRQLPVRKLMKQYWQTITQVTPVVAASPDSVARFLDIDVAKFDLVVFDEASQIRVAAAIGALGRASQAIIVGDTEQMPPTALFQSSGNDTPEDLVDEEDLFNLNDQESILSMAGVSQIPSTMLTWHYRSNDELLIAFSNKYIYEGKLSSFPSPRIGEGKVAERKLKVNFAPDIYNQNTRKGGAGSAAAENDELAHRPSTNLGEAKRVVAEIQKRVRAAGNKQVSLGVITMNEQQRKLIEELLDALDDDTIRRARNPEIKGNEQDYIFVRALERVQGDERDIILFSIGFAPTEPKGKLNMSFGPLTRARSERRLNVAVTRARKEMIVFSSFTPDQMVLSETSSKGLRLLQKFLVLAHGSDEGAEAINVASTNIRTLKDRHRTDIADALRAERYTVFENVGLSNFRVDIAVADPRDSSKCILGIMLDGEGWKARNSSSDREVLPNVVLKNNMKWPSVERIWLPMWLRDRDGEISRIKLAIATVLAAAELNEQAAGETETVELSTTDISITGLINVDELLAPEVAETPEPAGKGSKKTELGVNIDDIPFFRTLQDTVTVDDKKVIDYLHVPKVQAHLLSLIDQLTQIEGPVSEKRATVFVAKCFGFTTVQEAKRNYILENIPAKAHERDEEGFLYPKGVKPKSFHNWSKQAPGSGRSIAEISLTELSNAMAYLCGKTGGMVSAELAKQTSLAFGITKLTNTADARMVAAEKYGVKRGILADQDGTITNPKI